MDIMVNFNGELLSADHNFLNNENRGLRYGDGLFETIRVVNKTIFFWEDHYLRLMSSMRMLRMEIPMNFTMKYLEGEILKTIEANGFSSDAVRIRMTVFRNNGGLYLPETNDISFCLETKLLETSFYTLDEAKYEVELFKDFYVNTDLLSTLKTSNKIINVVGSIFSDENGYDNCILLNHQKQVVEFLNGNIFIVKDNVIKTPPLKDGCVNGILRKKTIDILKKSKDYTIEETSISPFELQKADELFMTNSIVGVKPITKYRKKEFSKTIAKSLVGKLNALARLSDTN